MLRLSSTPSPALRPPRRRAASDAFLVRLGRALHRYGTPADALERALEGCARALSVPGQFFATPTSLFVALGEGPEQRTHLVRVTPGEPDLGRLVDVGDVLDRVQERRLSPREGYARLDALEHAPPRYGPGSTSLAWGLASAAGATFFGGGAAEVAWTLLLGVVLGALTGWTSGLELVRRIHAPLAAALVAFLTLTAGAALGVREEVAILGSLIVLVPGLTLTVAMNELASGHWVGGTARLAGAGIAFLTMGMGVALGRSAALAAPAVPLAPLGWGPLPAHADLAAAAVAPLAFAVLFRARRRDAPAILLVGVAGFAGTRLGAAALGPELGAFGGALVVGLASELVGRLRGHPASVTLVPGILMLVPGSLGFRSVASFFESDVVHGLEDAFRAAQVAVALVGGVLLASALARPRRAF